MQIESDIHCKMLNLDSTIRLNNGLEIPRLGLGVYQTPPGRSTRDAVQYALEIGYRHIDTAMIYGNEADVGKAVRESGLERDKIFVTTKVWNSDQGYDSTIKACNKSLERLGLKYIDLYLVHWPFEETLSPQCSAVGLEQCRELGIVVDRQVAGDILHAHLSAQGHGTSLQSAINLAVGI